MQESGLTETMPSISISGKPGMLQSMGLQSQTWLSDWTECISALWGQCPVFFTFQVPQCCLMAAGSQVLFSFLVALRVQKVTDDCDPLVYWYGRTTPFLTPSPATWGAKSPNWRIRWPAWQTGVEKTHLVMARNKAGQERGECTCVACVSVWCVVCDRRTSGGQGLRRDELRDHCIFRAGGTVRFKPYVTAAWSRKGQSWIEATNPFSCSSFTELLILLL